jgi:FkbM family methyltransferase
LLSDRGLPRLRAVLVSVKSQTARVLRKSGVVDYLPLTIKHPYGFRMKFSSSLMARNLWVDPDFYAEAVEGVLSRLEPGDTFVDVGANIGLLSIAAATKVYPGGKVVAIEPHPRTFHHLMENVKLNGYANVYCNQTAVGEEEGVTSLTERDDDSENGVGADGIAVTLRRIDSMTPPGPIALLKIDVEGYELFALRGATETLSRTHSVLYESFAPLAERYGYECGEVDALLEEQGFAVRRLNALDCVAERVSQHGHADSTQA